MDDEAVSLARQTNLADRFQRWVREHRPRGVDPEDARCDAEIAMQWKYSYSDAELTRWDGVELDSFLLEWCPRKLSLPADACVPFVQSIAAWLQFLSDDGLLDDGPALARDCRNLAPEFRAAMTDPSNFGMAKGLLGGLGDIDPSISPEDLAGMLEDYLDDRGGLALTVGPVRLPGPEERSESVRAAPVLAKMATLWEFCGATGRALTGKGNLRLADARHLVDALDTGDRPDLEIGEYTRKLSTAVQLPGLNWLVELALAARVVRRHRGKLVAVGKWGTVEPVDALERLTSTALELGLCAGGSVYSASMDHLEDFIDSGVGRLLAELLDNAQPVPVDNLVALLLDATSYAYGEVSPVAKHLIPFWTYRQLDRLAILGVVTVQDVATQPGIVEPRRSGGTATLTPAGVHIAVDVAQRIGINVAVRVDPATATAAEMLRQIPLTDPTEWLVDAKEWLRHRRIDDAVAELGAALADPALPTVYLIGVLAVLPDLLGERHEALTRTLLGGPNDGIAVFTLVTGGQLDPGEIDEHRFLGSVVDTVGAILEVADPRSAVETLATVPESATLVEKLWRTERPSTAAVLEAIGAHHPDKSVAKTARKGLMRYRSRSANRR